MEGKDKGDIYAVLYEADDVEDFLDGYNSLNSNKIIALARIPSIEKRRVSGNSLNYLLNIKSNR